MFCSILSVLKLSFFRLYAYNLKRNFSSAVDDYFAIDTEEKRTIMRRHAYMGRMMCYSILFFAYAASSIFMLLPMLAGENDVVVNIHSESSIEITYALNMGFRKFSTLLEFILHDLYSGIYSIGTQ